MRSCPDSTLVEQVQERLGGIADELTTLDRELETLVWHLVGRCDVLSYELRGMVQAVRDDVLSDAVETLATLAHFTEQDALARREAVDDLANRLGLAR